MRHIADVLEAWPFDPIYGGWWDRVIARVARQRWAMSVKRYLAAVSGPPDDRAQ